MLIETYLKESKIHGIGIFSKEDIPKGKKIWKFHKGYDRNFSQEELLQLPEPIKKDIIKYGYKNKKDQRIVYCIDNAKFFNHSSNPNTKETSENYKESYTVTIKNIKKNEELTCNYFELDLFAPNKIGHLNNS